MIFSGHASKFAESVDSVMLFIVASSVFLLVGITAAMIYFVIKYSKKRNPVASQIEDNTVLEILWIVLPTILALFMFYYGYTIFKETRVIPKGAMTVKVIGRMWAWEFRYANGKKSDTLYLPANKPVKFDLISSDVNHAFFLPAFRIKEDIIAGRQNYMVLEPAKTGVYDIVCAEYCGMNHSLMHTKLKVLPKKEFYDWLNSGMETTGKDSVQKASAAKDTNVVASSQTDLKYLTMKGCFSCHGFDGNTKKGTSFAELTKGTTTVITKDGVKTIKINDDYLRKSITDPNADIVKGYAKNMMPHQMGNIKGNELDSLIKELKEISGKLN